MRNDLEAVKVIHRYSDSLKRKIVEEIESGELTAVEAMDVYGIRHKRTVTRWVQQLGKNVRPTQVVRVMMKSEQERIKELEKALADAQLENFAMKNLVAVIEEDYGEAIKKKLSTERLKELEEYKKKAGIA